MIISYPEYLQFSLLPLNFSIFLLQLDMFSLCLPSLFQLHNKNVKKKKKESRYDHILDIKISDP